MNSRDPFPDEELRRRIMDFIMAAGQTICGSSTFMC